MRTKPSPEDSVASNAEEPPTEPVVLEPPAAAPSVLTVEEWAARKRMLPKFTAIEAPFPRKRAAPAQKELNPLFLSFAQAQAHFSWPIGKELTEAEFDAAVVTATTNIYR